MCGITGIFAHNELGRVFMTNLSRSVGAIAQRGPDSQGTFIDHRVGLGHRRLSILDVSNAAKQPMSDDTGRFTIIFNGEIYNFRALKKGLEAKGINFRSDSDTEVLLHLYIEERENCVHKLEGFFAFAVFDKQEDSLFITRDRIGIKPLIYLEDEDKVIFASEMKAIMAYGIDKKLDFTSLHQYFQLNYIPSPNTIFEGVRKLEPGHSLLIRKKKVEKVCWYSIPYDEQAVKGNKLDYDAQQEKLRDLMDASVRKRMIADVPLGSFLSGGIDSSVVVAYASRYTERLNTFSIGYRDEPFYDETKYANLVAKKYNTEHTVFSLTNQDLFDQLFSTLDYIDEPFADPSALAVNILSEKTRKKVTVALSGDGADELFGGYNKYMGEYKARHPGMLAKMVGMAVPLLRQLPTSRSSPVSNKVRQALRFGEGMALDKKDRYYRWCSITPENDARQLFSTDVLGKLSDPGHLARKKGITRFIHEDGDLNEVLLSDMHLVLVSDMLHKVDMNSMANGLEVRVPFLDHDLVNFGFTLPVSSKVTANMKKRIVQDAFRDLLPQELYNRPKKGFEVPMLKWFRNELKGLITDDLLSDRFIEEQGLFDIDAIREIKTRLFSNNPGDVQWQVWAFIVFQSWWKKWMR